MTALLASVSPAPRKYIRLSAPVWGEVEALWLVGEVTLDELSKKYGVSPRTLQAHFNKAGTVKGAKAAGLAAAARDEVLRSELGSVEDLALRSREVRDRAYLNATIIEGLIMAQLALAVSDPTKMHAVGSALKSLHLASGSMDKLHQLKYRALGLDKDTSAPDTFPELIIRDLTEAEIAALQVDDGDAETDDLVEDDLELDDAVDAADDSEIVEEDGDEITRH